MSGKYDISEKILAKTTSIPICSSSLTILLSMYHSYSKCRIAEPFAVNMALMWQSNPKTSFLEKQHVITAVHCPLSKSPFTFRFPQIYSSSLIGLITFAMSQHASSSTCQLQRTPLAAIR